MVIGRRRGGTDGSTSRCTSPESHSAPQDQCITHTRANCNDHEIVFEMLYLNFSRTLMINCLVVFHTMLLHMFLSHFYLQTLNVLIIWETDITTLYSLKRTHKSITSILLSDCINILTDCTVWVKKIPPTVFWNFFPNGFWIFNQFLHTYYTIISTLEYKFLFKYLQLWQSYAILSATT